MHLPLRIRELSTQIATADERAQELWQRMEADRQAMAAKGAQPGSAKYRAYEESHQDYSAAADEVNRLQEWMGHRDLSTTQRYADYAPNAREVDMVDMVEAAFFSGRSALSRARRTRQLVELMVSAQHLSRR